MLLEWKYRCMKLSFLTFKSSLLSKYLFINTKAIDTNLLNEKKKTLQFLSKLMKKMKILMYKYMRRLEVCFCVCWQLWYSSSLIPKIQNRKDISNLYICKNFEMVGWLDVFYIPSTMRSFRDSTPIYWPLQRTWSSVFTPNFEHQENTFPVLNQRNRDK